jgi:hypothetical protein
VVSLSVWGGSQICYCLFFYFCSFFLYLGCSLESECYLLVGSFFSVTTVEDGPEYGRQEQGGKAGI